VLTSEAQQTIQLAQDLLDSFTVNSICGKTINSPDFIVDDVTGRPLFDSLRVAQALKRPFDSTLLSLANEEAHTFLMVHRRMNSSTDLLVGLHTRISVNLTWRCKIAHAATFTLEALSDATFGVATSVLTTLWALPLKTRLALAFFLIGLTYALVIVITARSRVRAMERLKVDVSNLRERAFGELQRIRKPVIASILRDRIASADHGMDASRCKQLWPRVLYELQNDARVEQTQDGRQNLLFEWIDGQ